MSNNILKSANLYGKTLFPKMDKPEICKENCCEKSNIRCEAQDNGNVNWDDDFTYFCEFIKQSLIEQPIFSKPEKEKICVIMNYLKECGVYAQRFNDGKISDNDVLPEKFAYTKDNLYDIICDFIGRLQNKHPEPIKYSINNSIKR